MERSRHVAEQPASAADASGSSGHRGDLVTQSSPPPAPPVVTPPGPKALRPERPAKTHKRRSRPPFDCIALLGGGALGSYQAGVYEAMAEAGLAPDWVAGISIGSINAAFDAHAFWPHDPRSAAI